MGRWAIVVALGALSSGAIVGVSACASLMGVDEPTLATPEGGSTTSNAPVDGAVGADDAIANADGNTGAPCGNDNECTTLNPSLPKCLSGKCVECVSTPADSCIAGRYCLPTHECATGCKADTDCKLGALPFCDTLRHQCVECLKKADCNGAKECSPAGTCADKCSVDGGAGCSGGKKCCGDFCVDTTVDPFNCSVCNNKCNGGSPICCGGICEDGLQSPTNCGGCGIKCSPTNAVPSCTTGSCTWACANGFGHCQTGNTGCETSTTTVANCGACKVDCEVNVKNATQVACASGTKCDYAMCKNGFIDGDNNRANGCEACGAVGQTCCANQACQGAGVFCGENNDNKCHECKVPNSPCTPGSMGKECCGGKYCQPQDNRCH